MHQIGHGGGSASASASATATASATGTATGSGTGTTGTTPGSLSEDFLQIFMSALSDVGHYVAWIHDFETVESLDVHSLSRISLSCSQGFLRSLPRASELAVLAADMQRVHNEIHDWF